MFFCVQSRKIVQRAKQIIYLYTQPVFEASDTLLNAHTYTHSPLIATVLWSVKIKPFLTEICLFEMYPTI